MTILLQDGDEAIPMTSRFRWLDRVGCVEALAVEYLDNGGKYDLALRAIRLRDYAFNVSKIPVKQKNQLRKDAIQRAKDIQYMRESAEIGDTVRVPKLDYNPLLGGYKRDGRKLVDAVIIEKTMLSSACHYTVKRIADGMTQRGNGHMIKAIIQRGGESCGSSDEGEV
ncbi:hypothetical protein D3C74_109770 [compost metagenome]